jgi:hypothetical protein
MVAQYDADPGVYLFYCAAEWNTVTDTYHDAFAAALDQASCEFGPVEFVGRPMPLG